jgi:hypothetical protein
VSRHRKRTKKIKWQIRFKRYFAPTQFVLRVIGEIFQVVALFAALVIALCPECHRSIAVLTALGIVGKTLTNWLRVIREENADH